MSSTAGILGLVLVLVATSVTAGQPGLKSPAWAQLTADQQTALRPLRQNWDQLPDLQRRRLAASARRYADLAPQQQQRFSQRLLAWSRMSLEERNSARRRYLEYSRLPKHRQSEIKQRWAEQNPEIPPARQDRAPESNEIAGKLPGVPTNDR